MKQIIKTFSLVLVSLPILFFASSCKDDPKPQEQEVDLSVSYIPPQAQIEREGQMVTTQFLITGQEVEYSCPTKYSASFAYDETVGTLLFPGKGVQGGVSIPLASLTDLNLTYQAKELVGSKVRVTVTNDAPKAVSKEATWTVNTDDTYSMETSQGDEGEPAVRGTKNLKRVPAGTELTVFVTPADGWELVALTANDVDILKSKTFKVVGNTTVRAAPMKKAPTTYAVTLTEEGEGKVVISGADSLGAVVVGTKLMTTATSADGWDLVALTANGADTPSSKTPAVYNPTEVRVTFTEKALTTHAVALTKEGEGKVVITGTDNLGAVRAGTKLMVTATLTDGWELTALAANGTDTLSSKTFVVYNPTEVRATFTKKAPKTYGVTLTKEGEGKAVITGADNLGAVRVDTKLTIAATPVIGWGVKSTTASGKDITIGKGFVVTGNTIVKVVFVIKTCPVAPTKGGDGRAFILEADNLGAIALGPGLTVIAEPYPGWGVKSITANGKDITTDKTFAVSGATDINVVFYKVPESRAIVRYDPTEIAEMSFNDLPPLMTPDGPSLHTTSIRTGNDVRLSIKAKDGYRTIFVASDPSGLLRLMRRTSSEAEYLISTSKHQEVEVLVYCTCQS